MEVDTRGDLAESGLGDAADGGKADRPARGDCKDLKSLIGKTSAFRSVATAEVPIPPGLPLGESERELGDATPYAEARTDRCAVVPVWRSRLEGPPSPSSLSSRASLARASCT